MAVLIDNQQKKYKISLNRVRQTAKVILGALGCPEAELSILIVDDPHIARLNQAYLHRRGPTNVIAFPMGEGEFASVNPQLLGDVVISAQTAAREGRLAGIPLERRMDELLVHGVLHLMGYDHEKDEAQALEMREQSRLLLQLIAKTDSG